MLEHGISRAGLDVSAVLATMLQDPGSERVQGHLVRTIIAGLNRFLVAAKLVGHGRSISQPATRLSTSNLASVPCDRPNSRQHGRLFTDAGGIRSLALTSRYAVVIKDGVWTEVAPTVGVEVTLLVPALYRISVVVVPLNVTHVTSGRSISTDGKAHAIV